MRSTRDHDANTGLPYPELSSSLPTKDQRDLQELRRGDIPSWALENTEHYERHDDQPHDQIATHKSLHNAAVPIHSLPPELLMQIFSMACQVRSDTPTANVCRLWRRISLAMPEIWTRAVASTVVKCTLPSDRAASFLRMAAPRCGGNALAIFVIDANTGPETHHICALRHPHPTLGVLRDDAELILC